MQNASFRLLLLAAVIFNPVASNAADRCRQIADQLDAELEATLNRNARERAAIADLKRPYDGLAKKLKDKEITGAEYSAESEKWSKAETCMNAENGMKEAQAHYIRQLKYIEAKCDKGPISDNAYDLRSEIKRRDNKCSVADIQTLASMKTQVNEIMADKAAKEEPETPAVKQVDASLKQSEFCNGIRAASTQASTFFKSIIGEKKSITEEGFGFPGTKMRELLQRDVYTTPIVPDLDFLSSKPSCDVTIGFNPVLVQRVPPTYGCTWSYEKISRRDLEQKADRLFNVVRGCFAEVSEAPVQVYRHSFIAEKSAQVEGGAYFGEGKPSNISIQIRKYTPAADLACAMYLSSKKEADREVCMEKHIRN
ncbi:hypothetical protein [Bradyrhizobium sp. STM 3561]|uniref:hypothetical protein n=1 Tax=Bradyrhizobium sp. STM 3561 TaxID=578923 RepID=UPI00388EEE58